MSRQQAASVHLNLNAACGVQSARGPTEEAPLVTVPPVCQQAIQEREAQALARALEYDKAEIIVELVDLENVQDAPSESCLRPLPFLLHP